MKKNNIYIFLAIIISFSLFFNVFLLLKKDNINQTVTVQNIPINSHLSHNGTGSNIGTGKIVNNGKAVLDLKKPLVKIVEKSKSVGSYLSGVIKIKDFDIDQYSKNDNKKVDYETAIYQIIYNETLLRRALIDYDIKKCDENSVKQEKDVNYSKYCQADYYIDKLIETKDLKYCDNFKNNFDYGYIITDKFDNKTVCTKLSTLALKTSVTKEEINSFLTEIQGGVDQNSFILFDAALNKINNCNKIDNISMKLKCYGFIYNREYFDEFKTKIYPELTKTSYIN